MTNPSEPHFFSLQEAYDRGWAWYTSRFANASQETAIGEGSTSFTMHIHRPDAPRRIAAHLPDVRLIYIVRHPLMRIESAWKHL